MNTQERDSSVNRLLDKQRSGTPVVEILANTIPQVFADSKVKEATVRLRSALNEGDAISAEVAKCELTASYAIQLQTEQRRLEQTFTRSATTKDEKEVFGVIGSDYELLDLIEICRQVKDNDDGMRW